MCPYKHFLPQAERPELRLEIPNGGLEIQDSPPVFWDLPCGRSVCCSIMQFRDMREDEMLPLDSTQAYIEIAGFFRFDVLKKAPKAYNLFGYNLSSALKFSFQINKLYSSFTWGF